MTGKYQTYSQYQDTGVEWLGEIPGHWEVKKLKFLASIQPSNVDKKTKDGELAVRLCNYTDVYYNDKVDESLEYMAASATEEQIEKFTLKAGDTIITKDSEDPSDIAIPTYVPSALPGVVCGYHLALIRPFNSSYGSFIKRVFEAGYARAYFCTRSNGLTRYGLGSYPLNNVIYPSPPKGEAETIANFLDHETAKIDTMIDKQQQLIKLLKEKRQAVISHAVTKGLNPDAPMKDSGVEWLGEVPEHWDVAFLKYFWTVWDCKHITAEFVEDGIPLASIKEVKSWVVDLNEAKKTTESFYELLIDGNRKPQFGDIIYSRNATVGEAALVPENVKFAMGQDVCLLKKQTEFNSEYFLHQLNSPVVKLQLESLLIGSTFKRINVEEIRNYLIVSPPIEEQAEIADHLQTRANRYDQLIGNAETAIALMQERRTALISAAVTGKIDVRNWQPKPVGCGEPANRIAPNTPETDAVHSVHQHPTGGAGLEASA